jgi:hypothetical protein
MTYDFTHVDGGLVLDLGLVLEGLERGWKSKKKCSGCVDFGKLWEAAVKHFASR